MAEEFRIRAQKSNDHQPFINRQHDHHGESDESTHASSRHDGGYHGYRSSVRRRARHRLKVKRRWPSSRRGTASLRMIPQSLHRDSTGRIVGSAVDIIRYHMEIRGLGIIHVPSLFGVASVRGEMRLDLIVHLHRPIWRSRMIEPACRIKLGTCWV